MRESLSTVDVERPEQLAAYLRREGYMPEGEVWLSRRISGGVSNRTVLVERPGRQNWVIKQALPKLRVEAEWYCDPRRIHREADGLRWLGRLLPPGATPQVVFEDLNRHILAMTAVPDPHENWKDILLDGGVRRRDIEQFARLLAQLHRCGYEQRRSVRSVFMDASFFETLRLEPYYAYTADRLEPARTFLENLIAETRMRRDTLVHGDFSPKNVLVHEDQLVLLDHEVLHFGDPAFDVGFSLTHLLSKAHHIREMRDTFGNAARIYAALYLEESADLPWRREFEPRAVRHLLACLLARVDGRSPLEYLTESERVRQRAAALALLDATPSRLDDTIGKFLSHIDS